MIFVKPKVSYACGTCLSILPVCASSVMPSSRLFTIPCPMSCCPSYRLPCHVPSALPEARMSAWLCTSMPVRHTVRCISAERISRAADEALQQGSESQPQESSCSPPEAQGADPATRGGGGWKGQQGVIGDLVHLWVAWSPQPCQTMLRLLHGALAQVPSQPLTGKKAQEPVVPYPGDQCHPDCACESADS